MLADSYNDFQEIYTNNNIRINPKADNTNTDMEMDMDIDSEVKKCDLCKTTSGDISSCTSCKISFHKVIIINLALLPNRY
jgi:hypothetical protein